MIKIPFFLSLFFHFFKLAYMKISWLTRQGYPPEYIEEVMAAEAELEREGGFYDDEGQFFPDEQQLQQQNQKKQLELTADSEIKAAQEAAKVASEAAKNLLGGVTSLGGSLLGKAASSITKPQQQHPNQKQQQQQKSLDRTTSVKSESKAGDSDSEDAKGEKRVTFGPDIQEEETVLERRDHRPKFVKHINKTRTMSGKQKWEWAFDRIIQVRFTCFVSVPFCLCIFFII
jgi:ribosomal protein S16